VTPTKHLGGRSPIPARSELFSKDPLPFRRDRDSSGHSRRKFGSGRHRGNEGIDGLIAAFNRKADIPAAGGFPFHNSQGA
jgi:hypothetical protein